MPKAAFCGLPHSESEVYYVKSSFFQVVQRQVVKKKDHFFGKCHANTALRSDSVGISSCSGCGDFSAGNERRESVAIVLVTPIRRTAPTLPVVGVHSRGMSRF